MAPRARYLLPAQADEVSGLDVRTIRHLLDVGRLPFVRVPGDAKRTRLVPREAAESIARQLKDQLA